MSTRINLLPTASVQGGTGLGLMLPSGNPWTVSDEFADELINRGLAVQVDQDLPPSVGVTQHPITAVQVADSVPGVAGDCYELADGPNRGAKLAWAIPAGESTPTWCWWLWPQSAYTA